MPASATKPVGSSETLVLPTTKENVITSQKEILHHHKNQNLKLLYLKAEDTNSIQLILIP